MVCFRAAAADNSADEKFRAPWPMLENQIHRPLRYFPVDGDFVITNGAEFFNRPLYGGNTAFRVDAGDRPEFSFYDSGRNGNLRLGIKSGGQTKWLNDAAQIIARYRPGSMLYEIHDPILDSATLHLDAIATREAEGFLLRVQLNGVSRPVELICAFGGVNGERGRRNGDIGCESKPVSEFFQLRPEQCQNNHFEISNNYFSVRGKPCIMAGTLPPDSVLKIADAAQWQSLSGLLESAGAKTEQPVVIGEIGLPADKSQWLGIQRFSSDNSSPATWRADDLARQFAREENLRRAIANRVVVDTPDPFINAAGGALNIAADAVWDERQHSFMHGAVAWRNRLLGWRGMYSGDELGWHERTAEHFAGFAREQITAPVPDRIPPADTSANLSRNEAALHSNGDMTKSHYDMNLVAVDAFFRHLLWTGDLDFARKMWPVIERHFAWERRLFRREFGPEKLPLYEAYCCIWASDDLAYDGGGAAHSSAYNFFENQMAARVATLLGKNPSAYERESTLIVKGMREELWLKNRGWFGEWKDLLGLQLVHPNAAAWTFYHTVDSRVPTGMEAWQMSRFVDTQIARIPIRGDGVPEGNFTMPTTSWMPYTWSLNNVVLAESTHTALAYWEAGRGDAAFPLLKGALLDSMFLGLCPGNVGMTTYFDVYRRESQRDFADGVGSLSRAMVEGLFGIQPDALAGELKIRPGFPTSWNHAAIRHPDFDFAFRRDGNRETYTIESKFGKPMSACLQIAAFRDEIAGVTVNGQRASWRVLEESIGAPRIEIVAPAAPTQKIVVNWKGTKPAPVKNVPIASRDNEFHADCGGKIIEIADPQNTLNDAHFSGHSLNGTVSGVVGNRTVFAKIEQGDLRWWQPVEFEIRPAWEIIQSPTQDANHLRFRIRNNTPEKVNQKIAVRIGASKFQARLNAAAFGISDELVFPSNGLLPGSNPVVADLGNGTSVRGDIVNWKISAAPKTRFEALDLTTDFNDRVTQIFRNEYLLPRSPFCSLALPTQGIGSWCHPKETFTVDDSGLRKSASKNNGRFSTPEGVSFEMPTDENAKNILFTSQWKNYPERASIPLQGKASHIYLLMAGSSNPMQSRFDNGEVTITYADDSTARLALRNPTTWWPIDQDYFMDDFAFRRPEPIPPRVDLKTGNVRVLDPISFKGKGGKIPGGAATILDLPLDRTKELKSLTVRAIANEVVIGLMSATLVR